MALLLFSFPTGKRKGGIAGTVRVCRDIEMTKQVELLAPCGSYESFLAAVNAGADAVYLGGRQFGARAYAENFSQEELIKTIRQAHFEGIKVYLTVNTLVKEREFSGIADALRPLYEAGLDGAIVQDMGVLCFLKRNFPGLKLHASTQMTITGAYGAAYLRELGCERIVPARELSLEEIQEIKRLVSVEIEAFIHGAMCYCYSGQCLMSSMIGGRSGNRGRCAGPCRLPYRTAGKEGYYLSLKDMNTLEHIPELIEAGIDSFKIEGRMKRPEYVAGVVSVYRKYIDRYYREKAEGKASGSIFSVEEKDRRLLSDLYIRSETGTGYYKQRNGRDMLTLRKPGYNEADPALLAKLRERYVRELPQKGIRFFVKCKAGEPLYGEVRFMEGGTKETKGREVCLSQWGDPVERAEKRAVSEEEIRGQFMKTGGTPFTVETCIVEAGEDVFVPLSRINALRRELLEKVYTCCGARKPEETGSIAAADDAGGGKTSAENTLTVMVQTREQFDALFPAVEKEFLVADADLLLEDQEIQDRLSAGKIRWGIKCPVILRGSDEKFLQRLRSVIEERKPDIVYCASVDGLAWLKSISYTGQTAAEASLYVWNAEAAAFFGGELDRISIPFELNTKEIRELCTAVRENRLEAPVYGRTPFMVSANCIKLSAGNCDGDRRKYTKLTDRMGNVFPVYTNCSHCYNIIYNCLPTSFAEDLWMFQEDKIRAYRVEFTTESGGEAVRVMQTFRRLLASERKGETQQKKRKMAGTETTKGRFRLGVE